MTNAGDKENIRVKNPQKEGVALQMHTVCSRQNHVFPGYCTLLFRECRQNNGRDSFERHTARGPEKWQNVPLRILIKYSMYPFPVFARLNDDVSHGLLFFIQQPGGMFQGYVHTSTGGFHKNNNILKSGSSVS